MEIERYKKVFIFDLETTGLPPRKCFSVSDSSAWECCRIVQIAWEIYEDGNLQDKYCTIVKPDGFAIPLVAANIHGITTDVAIADGVDIHKVFMKLVELLPSIDCIVAHNIRFDDNVMLSELHRYAMTDIITQWQQKPKKCTMIMGVPFTEKKRWPKLINLYRILCADYEESNIGQLHRADTDVALCSYCYFGMIDKAQ